MVSQLSVHKKTGVVEHIYPYDNKDDYDWIPNLEFYDELEFGDYYKGRSAVVFKFVSKLNNIGHNMCLSDFTDMLSQVVMDKGLVKGRWIYVKRGTAYGVQYVGP